MRRALIYLLLVPALTVGLGACGVFGKKQAPPQATKAPAPDAVAQPVVESANLIFVLPVDGVEGPARLVLSDAVAASLRDIMKPAILANARNERGPTIAGRVVKVRDRGSVVWVTANWELFAPYGTAVAQYVQEIVVDKQMWALGSPEAVNLVVSDAAPNIIRMVNDHVGPMPIDAYVSKSNAPPVTTPPDPEVSQVAELEVKIDIDEPAPEILPSPAEAPEMQAEMNAALPEAAVLETGSAAMAPPEPAEAGVVEPLASMPAPIPTPEIAPEPAPLELTVSDMAPEPLSVTPAPPPMAPPTLLAPTMEQRAEISLSPEKSFETEEVLSAPPLEPMSKAASSEAMSSPPEPEIQPSTMDAVGATAAIDAGQSPMPEVVPPPDNTDLPPVVWGKPSFIIKKVTGAPGNGNEVLTREIKLALRAKDLTITEDPRQAGYNIAGTVNIGTPVNGRQQARIVWTVTTMGGEEVGKAIQENVITAGSLDGRWGRVAGIVSVAAVNGIQGLFDESEGSSLNPGEPPYFPDAPELEQVPGRAPPPPS